MLYAFNAKAGIYIEPFFGYVLSGSGASEYSGVSTIDHTFTSPLLGAKLGYDFKRFSTGIELSKQKFFLDSDQSGAKASDQVSKNQKGLFGSFKYKKIQIVGTYFFDSEISGEEEVVSSGNQVIDINEKITDGKGYGIQLLHRWKRYFSYSLEYRKFSYDSQTDAGVENASFVESSLTEYLFTVSVPIGWINYKGK